MSTQAGHIQAKATGQGPTQAGLSRAGQSRAAPTAGPPEDGQDSNAQGELEASTGHTDP